MSITKKELKEIKKVALAYRQAQVFTSWDCYDPDPERWALHIKSVFLPIALGGGRKEHTFFYMYRGQRHEFPRPTINGYPSFDKVHCWNKEKEQKLIEILTAMESEDKKVLDKFQ
jgi:hypothetical protein